MTLMELLVVIAIIGVLAAVALPSIGGMRKSNVMANAVAQLTADIANARQTAIRERTTVHLIFVPPDILTRSYNAADPRDTRAWVNLQSHAYAAYAFFADRTVGDQPGQRNRRYLGSWRTLPEGVTLAEWEFQPTGGALWDNASPQDRPLQTNVFPFPTVNGVEQLLPHVSFDSTGAVIVKDSSKNRVRFQDEVINLARASIFANRDGSGNVNEIDWRESPPGNSTNDYNRIRIDGLSGRARVERREIQ